MTFVQRLVLALMPRRLARDIEAESRAWRLKCPCGHERTVWEAGGVRWKARGNPEWWARCPACGERRSHSLDRAD